jgi:transcription antitermination factor NusG
MWIVAVTRPRGETTVCHYAQLAGADCYAPQTRTLQGKIEALFPRYVFVSIMEQWRFLLSTIGVTALIMRGDGPAEVPPRELDRLWAMERNGLVCPPGSYWMRGDKVRVEHKLSGFGRYIEPSGPDRSRVLLDIMGRCVSVEVPTTALQAA